MIVARDELGQPVQSQSSTNSPSLSTTSSSSSSVLATDIKGLYIDAAAKPCTRPHHVSSSLCVYRWSGSFCVGERGRFVIQTASDFFPSFLASPLYPTGSTPSSSTHTIAGPSWRDIAGEVLSAKGEKSNGVWLTCHMRLTPFSSVQELSQVMTRKGKKGRKVPKS